MKNITLSADEQLIEEARVLAKSQKTTLNQLFREWLAELVQCKEREQQASALLHRLDYVCSGGPFTREQMNER